MHTEPNPVRFLTLDQAVSELAEQISDFEIQRSKEHFQGYWGVVSLMLDDAPIVDDEYNKPFPKRYPAGVRLWKARELSVHRIGRDVFLGILPINARDPISGETISVGPQHWRTLALQDQNVRAGVVCAIGSETVVPLNGREWVVERSIFTKYKKNRKRWVAASNAGTGWLMTLMRSPKTATKRQYQDEAVRQFGISSREFRRIWRDCIRIAGSDWGRPGRPRNSKTQDMH